MSTIFVSYSSTDVETASSLAAALKDAGYPTVFRDKDPQSGIPGGTEWGPELFSALGRSDIVVFLATEASLASPWCHTELAVATAENKFVAQISTTEQPTHPLLKGRQRIPPNTDLHALVGSLVTALTRAGLAPRDPFTWDPDKSPYPGLERLGEDHAAVLFGRDPEIAACIQRLGGSRPPPLLVTGPSGSGKSSLVRAGILPRLKLQAGTVLLPVVEPGNAPLQRIALAFAEAARAAFPNEPTPAQQIVDDPGALAFVVDRLLAGGGKRVVLFLDQAEDLVERAAIAEVEDVVGRLGAVDRDRLAVISAVRSVSLEDWLRSPALAPLAAADPIWVRPLDRSALREVIVGPAHVAGILFQPREIVDRILDDTVGGNALPLLAALLEDLTAGHTRRTPAVITSERYEAIGPVARVIERRAEEAAGEIAAEHRVPVSAVVDAYLRLADVDQQARVTAAEIPVDDLPADAREILAGLEEHRLVTRDQRIVAGHGTAAPGEAGGTNARVVDVVSAVHEAVFRAWPAVASAIHDRTRDLETRTWLARDARTWDESGRGQVALAGGRLTLASDWAERHPAELTPEMRAYVRAGVGQVRRRRLLTVAVPVLIVIALVVGALALRATTAERDARTAEATAKEEAARASAATEEANAARSEVDALRLVGDARQVVGTRPDLALLLALEASSRSTTQQIQASPLIGLTHAPGPSRYEQIGTTAESAKLDRGGHRAVINVPGATLLWDVDRGTTSRTADRFGNVLAMSADGSTYAADDGRDVVVRTWDAGEPVRCPIAGGPDEIHLLALSEDGGRIAVAWDAPGADRSRVAVVDLADCGSHQIGPVDSHVNAIDLDPAGRLIAVARGDCESGPMIWEVDTGKGVADPPTPCTMNAVRLGGDGSMVGAGASGELWARVMDTEDPYWSVNRAHDDADAGAAIALVPGTSTVVLASVDGQVRELTADPGTSVGPGLYAWPPIDEAGSNVGLNDPRQREPLDLAAGEGWAVSVHRSGQIVVWNLAGRVNLGPRWDDARFASQVVARSDGSVVTGGSDGARLFGPSGRLLVEYETQSETVESVSGIAANGEAWAFVSGSQLMGSQDAESPIVPLASAARGAAPVAGLPDDRWVLISDRSVVIVGPGGQSEQLSVSGDVTALATVGHWIYVGDAAGSIHILDADAPKVPERSVTAHATHVASFGVGAGGATLISGGDDRAIAVWTIGGDGSLTLRSRLTGNTEKVISVSITPDGHWLASGSEDGLVRLFNVDAAQEVGDPIPAGGKPDVAFDPTADRRLFVAHGGLDVWDLRPESWRAMACSMIGSRRLTQVEQDLYLRGTPATDPCP